MSSSFLSASSARSTDAQQPAAPPAANGKASDAQQRVAAATSTVLSLVGLSALRKRAVTKGEPSRGDLLQEHCQPVLDAARRGELSEADASRLISGAIVQDAERDEVRALAAKKKLPSILRFLFTSKVSWAMFTAEWVDDLARFLSDLGLRGKRVLEVCAGENTLAAPMRARGFDWVATDATLRETAVEAPVQAAALDAVRLMEPAAVFWSWWSEGADPMAVASKQPRGASGEEDTASQAEDERDSRPEDRQVAELCVARGLPMIFVGEGRGGITGSASFWAGPWRPALLTDAVDGFRDVPRWDGCHDRTWCLRPGIDTLPPALLEAARQASGPRVESSRLGACPPPPSPAVPPAASVEVARSGSRAPKMGADGARVGAMMCCGFARK